MLSLNQPRGGWYIGLDGGKKTLFARLCVTRRLLHSFFNGSSVWGSRRLQSKRGQTHLPSTNSTRSQQTKTRIIPFASQLSPTHPQTSTLTKHPHNLQQETTPPTIQTIPQPPRWLTSTSTWPSWPSSSSPSPPSRPEPPSSSPPTPWPRPCWPPPRAPTRADASTTPTDVAEIRLRPAVVSMGESSRPFPLKTPVCCADGFVWRVDSAARPAVTSARLGSRR